MSATGLHNVSQIYHHHRINMCNMAENVQQCSPMCLTHTEGPGGPNEELVAKNNIMCCYLGKLWIHERRHVTTTSEVGEKSECSCSHHC